MAEFAEVMRQANRLCKGRAYCFACPLILEDDECLNLNITGYMCENAEKIEKAIMDWAKEHQDPV